MVIHKRIIETSVAGLWFVLAIATCSLAQNRTLGLDVSAWQSNISQSTWNGIHNVDGRDFAFIRSSRGGTTGFYNQSDPNNNNGLNTLSQRYDDHYFVQNMTRATNAGLFAGPYHFSRPDIVASTLNSGGIANSGADEADHFIQMAGAWMRPGYLLPVHDLEAGDGFRSDNEMAQFALDFSDRVYDVMGIRPALYINGNYANFVIGGASSSLRNQVVDAHPTLWSARWPNQSDPDSIPVQTGHPKDTYSPIYGPWDDAPNPTHPWSFWQYASTGRLSSYNNGNSNLDLNVAQGGSEFLKDKLVPAMWVPNANGNWSNLASWNSGQTPIAPVQGPGQNNRVGPLTLPQMRLPGPNDTVVLDRAASNVTVSLTSGSHDIRKMDIRESLIVSGGSLTVNYIPSSDSTPWSARFSAPVWLIGDGNLNIHTVHVEQQQSFAFGGSLTINSLQLAPHNSNPASMNVVDNVAIDPWENTNAVIMGGAGSGELGHIDLGDANRYWTVGDGLSAVDLTIDVPIVNGALFKTGPGTLELLGGVDYLGDVVVIEGDLVLGDSLVADTADLFLSSDVELELDFSGSPDVVGAAYVNGVGLAVGTWGAAGSGAQFTHPTFSGPGTLLVTSFDPILAGDYNLDGIVDAADFTVWRDALGVSGVTPFSNGDGTGDGIVDLLDYDVWRTNYGMTATGLTPLVPEPHSMLSTWLAIGALFQLRRRAANSGRLRLMRAEPSVRR